MKNAMKSILQFWPSNWGDTCLLEQKSAEDRQPSKNGRLKT